MFDGKSFQAHRIFLLLQFKYYIYTHMCVCVYGMETFFNSLAAGVMFATNGFEHICLTLDAAARRAAQLI